MPSLDVRKRAFATWVKRVTDHAKQTRGWSVPRVAKESGIGPATLYRWLNAEWKEAPKPDQIEKMCDALDIAPAIPFALLWPGKTGAPTTPQPLPPNPDFDLLQRRLNDPNTPEAEKYFIRETISTLLIRGR